MSNQSNETCSECGKEPIVNRKYKLGNECNFKRLHGGHSRQEVYTERAAIKSKNKPTTVPQRPGVQELKKKYSINQVSKTKRITCHDGEVVSRAELHIKYSNVCKLIDQTREQICQGCGKNLPLSHAHIISRAHRPDLVCDPNNIQLHCFGSYHSCHETWERGVPNQIVNMVDFERNMMYVEKVAPDLYQKAMARIEYDINVI